MPRQRAGPAVLESVARRFRRQIWRSVPDDAVSESGVRAQRFGPVEATVFEELFEVESLNTIHGAAEPGAVEEGHLAAAIEWARFHEVECRVMVAEGRPGTAAAEAWLEERGYERGPAWVTYARDASSPRLPSLPAVEVIEVGVDDQECVSYLASEGLGLPCIAGTLFFSLSELDDWHSYIALLDGEPVACGSMMIHTGVAKLGVDATVDEARGHGCHQALLARRLLDAALAGCDTVFAEVGEREEAQPAHRNLLCAGFERAYASGSWRRPRGLAA